MALSVNDVRVAIRMDNGEAKQKLKETKKEITAVEKAMDELERQGKKNTLEYKDMRAKLQQLNRSHYELRVQAGLQSMTYEDLRKTSSNLKRQLDKTVPHTAEWHRLRTELGLVQQRMTEVSSTARSTGLSLGKVADGFNRFFGFITAGIAGLTALVMGFRQLQDARNQLEESQAGLKALTGLDDADIGWLTEQAKELSTTVTKEGLRVRQSAEEILQAYMLVGSAKPELLGNKEALAQVTEEAMRLQAAAKDIKLDTAVEALTLALNQYGADADQAVRFTNVLAAGSKAGSANIENLARSLEKSGTAAKASNVSIEESVGLLETLAEKGVKGEIAGTGLRNFFLKLKQGANDTNPAIVGLDTALTNLQSLSDVEIINFFGLENYTVAANLIRNTDLVKSYTDKVTDTNIAIEQSSINSATQAAKLAQARNQMKLAGIELAERLNPAFLVSTNLVTNMIKVLPGLIDWFKEWGVIVLELTVAIVAYTVAMKAYASWATVVNAATKLGATLKVTYAAATALASGNTAAATRIMRTFSGQMVTNNALKKTLIATTYLYSSALNLLKGNVVAAGNAFKAFRATMAVNPVAIFIAALAGLAYGMHRLIQVNKDYYDLKKINEGIAERSKDRTQKEIDVIAKLTDKIHDNNASLEDRREAIEELRKIAPDYQATLTRTGEIIDENTEALIRYNEQLAIKNEMEEIYDEIEKRREKIDKLNRQFNTRSLAGQNVKGAIEDEEEIISSLMERYNDLTDARIKALNTVGSSGGGTDSKCPTCGKKPCECVTQKTEDELKKVEEFRRKAHEEALKILDEQKQEELNLLKEKQLSGEVSEQQYLLRLFEIDIRYLEARKNAVYEYGDSTVDIHGQMLDRMIQESNRKYALIKKMPTVAEEEAQEDINSPISDYALKKYKETLDFKEQMLISQRANDLISEEEFQDKMNDIAIAKAKDRAEQQQAILSTVADVAGGFSDLFSAMQSAEESKISSRYDKQISAAKKAGKDTTKLEEEKEAAINEVKRKYADQQFAAMVLQVTATTAVAAMNAYSAMASIPVVGPGLGIAAAAAAVASGAAQIAVAKQQRDEAKGLKEGGYSDEYVQGFTSRGNSSDVAGVIPVHKNEFVTNHEGVQNPHVRQFLDVFDSAQKSGNIRMLNTTQILEQVRTKSGYYQGGFTCSSDAAGVGTKSMNAARVADYGMLLNRIIVLLESSNNNLGRIAEKEITIDVRAVRDGINRINRLESNVSR